MNQIKRNLHFPGEKADLIKVFETYNDLLQKNAKNLTLFVANKVYVHDTYQFNEQFHEVAVRHLMSGVETVNFLDATETAGIINDFVVEETNNKIKKFISSTSPLFNHTYPRILPINAMYIRISWKNVYESIITKIGEFHNSLFEKVHVDFMHFYYRHKFNYVHLSDLKASALEIKLTDSDFSLLLILPDDELEFKHMQVKLKRKKYSMTQITNQMREEFVEVAIPKFKIEYHASLKETMKEVCVFEFKR